MTITGAGPGIMEAGNAGAGRENTFGLGIRLPFEQSVNSTMLGDPKVINFKYFFTRKLIFVKETDALVLFPGGFGTMDEGFEVLTLIQTGKSKPMPVLCMDVPGGTFWPAWRKFLVDEMCGGGKIWPAARGWPRRRTCRALPPRPAYTAPRAAAPANFRKDRRDGMFYK